MADSHTHTHAHTHTQKLLRVGVYAQAYMISNITYTMLLTLNVMSRECQLLTPLLRPYACIFFFAWNSNFYYALTLHIFFFGAGNANFYYALTLAYGIAQVMIVSGPATTSPSFSSFLLFLSLAPPHPLARTRSLMRC